jgi:RNA polymerase sigma-70 factor (ECF subfamily)
MTLFFSTKRKKQDALFKELYKTHYADLYRFAKIKLNGDSQRAEDLVQECFLALWSKFTKLESYDKIKSFLYNVLNNKLIDFYRSNKLIVMEDLSEKVLDSEQTNDVHHYVLELPQDLQTVFLLNKYNSFKYSEIAEILGISVKTVESRMSKALKILKEKIKV